MSASETVYRRCPPWIQTLLLNAHALRIHRHRYGARHAACLEQLRRQERWTPEQLRRYQDERLREVVRIAYERTAYYRRAMDAMGVKPSDIRGVEDLPKLPLLTKDLVRREGHALLTRAAPARDWIEGHTSGTTGSPLSVWYDRVTCIMTNAVDRRHKTWAGMRDDDWIGMLLGRVVVPPHTRRPPFWRVNWVQRQVWFSSFHLTDDNLGSYVEEIRRRRLGYLEGYPSTLFILASYLLRNGLSLPMKAVITSSETLHAVQREMIERAFECRLFDFYAMAERVIYAGECEQHDGKHLAEEYGVAEVVDQEGNPVAPGERGYLVGTSLHNTAMPMIRYRMGDVSAVRVEPCACGRASRRIEGITTKAEDIVVTPDGRMISPSILTHPFKPFGQLVKSQIVQYRPDHIVVKIVPSEEFSGDHERRLLRALQERLGETIRVELQIVEDIPRERSGKYRWVISHVDHACVIDWEQPAVGRR